MAKINKYWGMVALGAATAAVAGAVAAAFAKRHALEEAADLEDDFEDEQEDDERGQDADQWHESGEPSIGLFPAVVVASERRLHGGRGHRRPTGRRERPLPRARRTRAEGACRIWTGRLLAAVVRLLPHRVEDLFREWHAATAVAVAGGTPPCVVATCHAYAGRPEQIAHIESARASGPAGLRESGRATAPGAPARTRHARPMPAGHA